MKYIFAKCKFISMLTTTANKTVDHTSDLKIIAETVFNKTVLQRLGHAAECHFIAHDVYDIIRDHCIQEMSAILRYLSNTVDGSGGKTLKECHVTDWYETCGVPLLTTCASQMKKCQLTSISVGGDQQTHASTRQPRGAVVDRIIKNLTLNPVANQCVFLSKTSFTSFIRRLLTHYLKTESVRLETNAIVHIQLYTEYMIRNLFHDALLVAGIVPRATVTSKDMSIVINLYNKYTRHRIHYTELYPSSIASTLLMTIKDLSCAESVIVDASAPGTCSVSPEDGS